MFKNFFEAPEAEVARLAAAPIGSISHSLSLLPVNIREYLGDLMIELPARSGDHPSDQQRTIIVVPFERYKDREEERAMPYRLHRGSWRCIVVASNHPSYPVGGHRLSVSEAELVRGTQRTFDTSRTYDIPTAAVLVGA